MGAVVMDPLAELVAAVSTGSIERARELLARNPALARTQHKGASPLHFAAIHNQRAAVDLLLDHGADLEDLDTEYGAAPIGWANEKGHMPLVRYLRERGSRVTLHTAAAFGFNDDVRRLARDEPDDLNRIVGYGAPLHLACLWGQVEAVEILLEHGADPAVRNPDGELAVTVAARQALPSTPHTPLVTEARRAEIIAGSKRIVELLKVVTPVRH